MPRVARQLSPGGRRRLAFLEPHGLGPAGQQLLFWLSSSPAIFATNLENLTSFLDSRRARCRLIFLPSLSAFPVPFVPVCREPCASPTPPSFPVCPGGGWKLRALLCSRVPCPERHEGLM